MRLKGIGRDDAGEVRYDEGTLRKVAALAARLQSRHRQTLTAREIQEIGDEVGLEPAFIEQALQQLAPQQPQTSRWEELLTAVCLASPLLWGAFTFLVGVSRPLPSGPSGPFLLWGIPAFLAFLLGLLPVNKKVRLIAAAELLLAFAWASMPWAFRWRFWLEFLAFGVPIGGLLGRLGASIRRFVFPQLFAQRRLSLQAPRSRGLSRSELLQELFDLQRQLEGQKQHRAFLSVDVVESAEMKRSGPELAAEYSFGQLRRRVEEIVRTCGGEMQSAAGDGVMCLFPTDAGAIRAARRLQEGLSQFNANQNRLPLPFHIRCGVSAGEVAIEEGMPLGHLQSPVIDRAAVLQKSAEPGDILVGGEVAAAALAELDGAEPLSQPVAGEPAFSWRARPRDHFAAQ